MPLLTFIYYMMGVLICKYESFWQEISVYSLLLRWPLRPVGFLFLLVLTSDHTEWKKKLSNTIYYIFFYYNVDFVFWIAPIFKANQVYISIKYLDFNKLYRTKNCFSFWMISLLFYKIRDHQTIACFDIVDR